MKRFDAIVKQHWNLFIWPYLNSTETWQQRGENLCRLMPSVDIVLLVGDESVCGNHLGFELVPHIVQQLKSV